MFSSRFTLLFLLMSFSGLTYATVPEIDDCVAHLKSAVSADSLARFDSVIDVLALVARPQSGLHFSKEVMAKAATRLLAESNPCSFGESCRQMNRELAVKYLRLSQQEWLTLLKSRMAFKYQPSNPDFFVQTLFLTLEWASEVERALAVQNQGVLTREFYEGLAQFILENMEIIIEWPNPWDNNKVVRIAQKLPIPYREQIFRRYLDVLPGILAKTPWVDQQPQLDEILVNVLMNILSTSQDWIEGRTWPLTHHQEQFFTVRNGDLQALPSRTEIKASFVSMIRDLFERYTPTYMPQGDSRLIFLLERLFERMSGKFDFLQSPSRALLVMVDQTTFVGSHPINPGVGLIRGISLLIETEVVDGILSRQLANKYVDLMERTGEQLLGHRPIEITTHEALFAVDILTAAFESFEADPENRSLPSCYQQDLFLREVGTKLIYEAKCLRNKLN